MKSKNNWNENAVCYKDNVPTIWVQLHGFAIDIHDAIFLIKSNTFEYLFIVSKKVFSIHSYLSQNFDPRILSNHII